MIATQVTGRPDRRSRLRPGAARALACALLLVLAALPAALPAQERATDSEAAAQLREKRRQVRQLAVEKAQIQEKLAYFQASEQELRLEVRRLSELVRESRRRKRELAQRIQELELQLARREAELAQRQAEIQRSRERIAGRLRRLYRFSKQNRSAYLFQAARFRTFARDTRYLALLQRSDRKAIRDFEALVRDTRERRRELARSLEQMQSLREEMDEESRLLAEREAFLESSLADLEKNRRLYGKYLQDLEEMMEGMEAAIRRLEARSARQERERRPEPAPEPASAQGTLPPPAPGRVVAAFGEQDPRYDLKKFQRGVVIRVADNAPVRAVAAGRAVHAGPFRGYQQLVVLDHGEGLFTVYGYLKALQIKRGQRVEQGAVLGRATFQAVDDAYNIYFEIRRDGTPQDPGQWLRPGSLQPAGNGAGG